MVYCGKASQGCKNCRGRRIKCDRAKPECSQCVRVGKKCPGYRDQLSLMFRDESTKVIQKAHAQWGIDAANSDSSYSTSTLSKISQSVSSPSQSPSLSSSSNQLQSLSTGALSSLPGPRSIGRTFDDQGIQFYIDRYVLAHKDEPGDMQSLTSSKWLWNPAQREVMAAIGLAALSNVLARRDMMTLARQRYGAALQSTASLITRPADDTPEDSMRMVVSLALFEVVQGTYRSLGIAGTHIMGAAALVRAWCLQNQASPEGVRALLQLCYPLFIPYHLSGVGLPQPLLDLISFCGSSVDPLDRPAIDLAALIGSYIQTHSCICRYDLSNRAKRNEIIQQLLDIEAKLAVWNRNLAGKWLFRVETNTKLPRQAVFNGKYHVYHDLWVARVLNHYRWARILLNQTVIGLVDGYDINNVPLVSPVERDRALATIRSLAMDVLLGAPSHWKHPALDEGSQISVEFPGKAGGGAPGIPVLILQLKVAACAPGVPVEYWEWALDNIRWIWRFMGMLHAQSMVDLMLAHHDNESVVTTERTKSIT